MIGWGALFLGYLAVSLGGWIALRSSSPLGPEVARRLWGDEGSDP